VRNGKEFEGLINPCSAGVWQYEYVIKDHLGNTRVNFTANGTTAKQLSQHHYYPFGMEMTGSWAPDQKGDYSYLYNGKEQHRDFGLGWYAYGARFYDPSIGQFTGVDPLADQMPSWSPYTYTFNNPINMVDPDGRAPRSAGGDPPMWGFQKVMSRVQGVFDNIFVNRTNTLNKVGSNNYVVSPQAQANAQKGLRIATYTGITIGGIITTVASAGTATGPYAAAFGTLTGVYATSAGISMTAAEIAGHSDAAASIPGTPLGVLGRAVDEATNNQSLSGQALGEIANGFVMLNNSDFSKWDALNTADKLGTISGIIDGVFNLAGQSVDPKLTENYSQQIYEMINSCTENCNEN
jgi:RHS repeat-associated protein